MGRFAPFNRVFGKFKSTRITPAIVAFHARRIVPLLLLACLLFAQAAEAAKKPLRAIEVQSIVNVWAGREVHLSMDVPGDSHWAYFEKLEHFALANDVRVVLIDFRLLPELADYGFLYGFYDKADKIVWVNSRQGKNCAVSTLLHELGHHFQPEKIRGNAGQVWAETFAQLVAQRIGLNSLEGSIAYLRTPDVFPFMWVAQYYSKELDALAEKVAAALQ